MSFQSLLPHVRVLVLLLAVAGLAWYYSRRARAALGDVTGLSCDEVMHERLGKTLLFFGLRELVVGSIAEVLVFFLPLTLAYSQLTPAALATCVVVAIAHTFSSLGRLEYLLLFRDIPADWHQEIRESQPLDPFIGSLAYGVSSFIIAWTAVIGQSLTVTMVTYIITRYLANRVIHHEMQRPS